MEESPTPPYGVSSPSLVFKETRARADSVPNLGDALSQPMRSSRPLPDMHYNKDSPREDALKSGRYLRLVNKFQEGQQLLSMAKTHGMRVTDENEQLRFDHSKLQMEYSNVLIQYKEEENKCQYRDELINDLLREKEDLTVELEQLQIKLKSHQEAQEDDGITLTHQSQSLQDLRTSIELIESENWQLKKELQLLTAKGKKDAEIIAEHKSKLHETERAYKHTLATLRNLEERHENFSVVAQKLRVARAQIEEVKLERDQFSREVETFRSKIEIQTLEDLNLFKQAYNDDRDVIPIYKLNCTPSPPLTAVKSPGLDTIEPSSLLTLLNENSNCSLDSQQRIPKGKRKQFFGREINYTNSEFQPGSTNPHQATTDPGQMTNALKEYLFMTASAIKIKFRDVHVSQDLLAKAGQSVPFWEAYDVMQEYVMQAETKQVLEQVNRYKEEQNKKGTKEQEWDSDEDDYKVQNNVPIYHWSVLTNPRSFFTRLSTEVADKLAPTTLFPSVTRITSWGQTVT